MPRGVCLSAPDLRERVNSGLIKGNIAEKQIQPASFEPTLSDHGFILDTRRGTTIRPPSGKTVYRALLEDLSLSERRERSIADGFQLNAGFTYLLPFRESIRLQGTNIFNFLRKAALVSSS